MFEQTTDYKAFYVGKFPSFEEDIAPALTWAVQEASKVGGGITVVAPTKDRFRTHTVLSQLPTQFGRETPRTLKNSASRSNVVVVSCWPTATDLDALDDLPGLKVLIVVPWNEDEIRVWRSARSAVDIMGGTPVPHTPTIADPVVAESMKDLTRTVNLSTDLVHPDDRSAAIQALGILRDNGHRFNPDEIRIWAMANGWNASGARQLADYAQGVIARKAYRVGHSHWRSDIIRLWRQNA